MVQLFHGGREVIASPPRPAAVAPSSVPSPRFKSEPRALSRREIREMIDGYRQAAVHAAQGGIDGVEVCAGFDYLPTQFLSPHVNRRTDEYGGSFENRLRFLREVCEAMREGIGPDGAVGCRLTDEHWSPDANDGGRAGRGRARAERRRADRLPVGRARLLVHATAARAGSSALADRAQRDRADSRGG